MVEGQALPSFSSILQTLSFYTSKNSSKPSSTLVFCDFVVKLLTGSHIYVFAFEAKIFTAASES